MKNLVWITAALLAACGDNLAGPDAGNGADAPITPDAPIDGTSTFTPPTPFSFGLSATGPDQMQGAFPGPNGTFYAAGFTSTGPTDPKTVVVARYTATGPDTTWGTNGIATTSLVTPGSAGEIDVVTQSDGKVIVASTVVGGLLSDDRDVAVIRLSTTGQLDTTFGVGGTRLLDLSSKGTGTVMDGARGLGVDGAGNIYVNAVQLAPGLVTGGVLPRTDSEFAVIKLTAAGAVDTNWATGGKYLRDIYIGNAHSNATPRGIQVLTDGTVVVGGYSNAITGTPQPVVFKLTPAGTPDTAFATGGLYHEEVLAAQTEVYNFAVHGNQLVTAGYGRAAGMINDWISLRFDLATGVRDTAWGGTSNGAVVFDPSGAMLGSNCRNAVALPAGKTMLIGSTGPSNMPAQDAVFAILDATGHLDTTFGTGIVKFELGANGNDQFWDAAVSGNKVLVVGYMGGGAAASQTTTMNDDAYGVVLTLP